MGLSREVVHIEGVVVPGDVNLKSSEIDVVKEGASKEEFDILAFNRRLGKVVGLRNVVSELSIALAGAPDDVVLK